MGKCRITYGNRMQLVVTKILSAIQKGDLAIALSQLGAIRQRFPEAKITTFIRRPELDRHWFFDADRVLVSFFRALRSSHREKG